MARPIQSPKRTPSAVELLPDDAVCRKCKYSLAGLPAGGVCPECGTPIVRGRKRHYLDENMTDAPVHYLRLLAAGCWCMALSGPVAAVFLLTAFRQTSWTWALSAAGAGAMWFLGVCIVTRPRETTARATSDLKQEWKYFRPIARLGSLGFAAGALAYAATIQATSAAIANAAVNGAAFTVTPELIAFRALSGLGLLVALCSLVPLSVILVDLSNWAGDTQLAERLRLAASGVAVGAVALALAIPLIAIFKSFGPLQLVLYGVVIVGGLLFAGGSLTFLVCSVQLAGMSLWAVSNSITAIERDERVAAKQAEHAEAMVGRTMQTGAATAIPAPPKKPGKRAPSTSTAAVPPPQAKAQSRPSTPPTRPPPAPGNPYDLAPEDT